MDKQLQTRAAGKGWAEGILSSVGGYHVPSFKGTPHPSALGGQVNG